MMDFPSQLRGYVASVEDGLDRLLPGAAERPGRLHEAMRYAVQGGGKRLRPVLAIATAEAFGGGADPVAAAVAVECIHAYSLVHDDLPCMDDDDLRRGRPSTHRAFDEATALLAGDALLTHAFALLAREYAHDPALSAALSGELAQAAGSLRLIGGQMEDLLAERTGGGDAAALDFIHLNKTAAMIEAPLVMGARCAGAGEDDIERLRAVGRDLGLAFQAIDDILDATADTATLGKTAGKDAQAGKLTSVSVHGLGPAREAAHALSERALSGLAAIPAETAFLSWLFATMAGRKH